MYYYPYPQASPHYIFAYMNEYFYGKIKECYQLKTISNSLFIEYVM